MKAMEDMNNQLLVTKFGGSAVADLDQIRRVARHVVDKHRAGAAVVVVVSAMGGETNRLLGMAGEVGLPTDRSERDVVAAAGEQVAAGLTALALAREGV